MTSQLHTLYLGSYAPAEQTSIYAAAFDSVSGQFTPGWSFSGIVNPSFIALHPNKRWLFAVSETSAHSEGRSGEVWALDLPAQNKGEQPRQINHQPSNGDWPCHLSIDASGRWLLVSNYQSGNVSVFPILANGALGELADNVQHHGSGPHAGRQDGPHTHSTIFTPDNRFVIVADLGIDQLVIYAFDTINGELREHRHVHCPPGSGPRHMTFHPNGQQFYLSCELNNTAMVYDYNTTSATLSERVALSTVRPGTKESLAADIHLTPAGDHLSISNRGDESLATFPIVESGLLGELALTTCGGNWPRHFAFDPTGHFVLVANQHSGEVTVLSLSKPDEPRARLAIPGASCVAFA